MNHQYSNSSMPYKHEDDPIHITFDNSPQNYGFDDEEEEEELRYGRVARGVTPDGYYEDIYGQYAQMDENLHDSTTPYKSTTAHLQNPEKDLNRNLSTSNRTDYTTSSSVFGGLLGSKRNNTTNMAQRSNSKSVNGINRTRHQRGMPSTALLSSPASRRFGWIPSTWPARLFILITFVEAAADISIEAVLLFRFRESQGQLSVNGGNLSALPVFLMVFGFAHVYQCFLAIDATVNRNTILVFGLVIFNLAFLVYALIQISEIRDVLGDGVIAGTSQTVPVQVLTGAIPVIIGLSSLIFASLAYFLWKEFGWQIYKTIGADRRLKRAHMHFQIFVCLLKFDFFTFIAFCVQLVLVVLNRDTPEFWVTAFAAPVTLFLLVFAWYSIRTELKWGTIGFMIALWGGAGYFAYKLFRIWQNRLGPYRDVYKSLTVFSVLALILLLATFLMTIRCMMNFDIGLKAAMARSAEEKKASKGDELASSNGHEPVISSPFQYELDGRGNPLPNSTNTLRTNGNEDEDAGGYFEPYNQAMAYSQSTHGLLSPIRSPQGLTPVKSTSAQNLERHQQTHRLSLD
ncbi:uncharacterized protein FA14DRAFT_161879 [Meira miltonrushii]|uniref:Uncharacterized protein n=1 Tax=Meira miltonrushii TaxID=1280837 RepID=A0A316V7G4_9BASI|nr:uncharacterized protein FA14DRAFT_161879 [Meira miltonrushii]PWN32441.1 hypothetical protein FA14DRAFT_161879 [Meira miltonrushii]